MWPNTRRPRWPDLLLIALLMGDCRLAFAESRTASIDDPRPVAKAMEILEKGFGLPITYEDPPYVHPSEMIDVTDQFGRLAGTGKNLIPRGSAFSFVYEVPSGRPASFDRAPPVLPPETDGPASKAAAGLAITAALKAYGVQRGADTFALVDDPGSFHVVPTRVTSKAGLLEAAKPLLDTAVSIFPKERTAWALLNEICESLSSTTGQKVVLGTVPINLLLNRATNVTATTESARSVLGRLLAESPVALSWQLFNDPGLHWFALNIHIVRPPTR